MVCLLEMRFSVRFSSVVFKPFLHVRISRKQSNACDDDASARAASCAPNRSGTDPFRAFVT